MMTLRSHGFRNLIVFLLKMVHSLQNKLITPSNISILLCGSLGDVGCSGIITDRLNFILQGAVSPKKMF